jgi:hypothetical protein
LFLKILSGAFNLIIPRTECLLNKVAGDGCGRQSMLGLELKFHSTDGCLAPLRSLRHPEIVRYKEKLAPGYFQWKGVA